MTPHRFIQANTTLGGGPADKYGTDDDVSDLPVFKGGGEIISVWRPSWRERLSILFGGSIWLRVAASRTHPPVDVTGVSPWT
jgi:hypothetical protein